MTGVIHAFHEGGVWMYPILLLGIGTMFIVVDRGRALYLKMNLNKEHFFKTITSYLLKGDLEGIILVCDQNPAPLSKVIKACLIKLMNNGSDAEIQAALDEGALVETPAINKGIGFMPVIGNAATLFGLLGTVAGMISGFKAVANADPATKAAMLSRGIAEAMNCTAFGLTVAIPTILLYAFMQSRAQHLTDEINEISIRTFNFIMSNRERFGVGGEGSEEAA